ncbi:MAG: superoxide dismutase [Candidatus Chromulinivorax sp.]
MFRLDPLIYSYDALEPYIDARTMEIHYTKHHQAYVDNLNAALVAYPDLQNKSIYDLLIHLDSVPTAVKTAVQNQGGGHYNHTMFWLMMCKNGKSLGQGQLFDAITERFGSFEQFKLQFEAAAKSRFGSGWAWLVVDQQTGLLEIISTANQDCPIWQGKHVVLGLDVWEHAYYLHYQNRRADYIAAWWHVVNWGFVQDQYHQVMHKL